MTTIHLKDFMTKGKFGLVEIGMKIDEVIKYLGEPDWQNDYDTGFSEIGYSWYEFFYPTETRILYAIQNDHLATFPNFATGRVNNKRDICFENKHFIIDTWFLKKNRYMTLQEVEKILNLQQIRFEKMSFEDFTSLTFESGVELRFMNHDIDKDDNSNKIFTDKTSSMKITFPFSKTNDDAVNNNFIRTETVLYSISIFDFSILK